MLRNVYFDRKLSLIHQWTYDDTGESIYNKVYFKPYLYIPAVGQNRIDAQGIDGVSLTKREFKTEWDKHTFLKTYRGVKYFDLMPTQQYMLEKYHKETVPNLVRMPLRTFFYDIEVIADEFPDPKDAKFPMTSMTIYDTFTKKYYVWGIKPYDDYSCKDHMSGIEPEEIVYVYCKTESLLLKAFLRFWRSNWPDLIVGYNSFSFDMPYIVKRLEHVLGVGASSKLSPVDNVYGREVENRFHQVYTDYSIGGISHLDYMILYKTFTPGERESDSLNFVCMSELKVGKLDRGGQSLLDLANSDWNRFVNYNIWDVKLMVMLDERRRYLDVARFSAVSGSCNLDKALGKSAIITGIIAKEGLLKDVIITTQSGGVHQKIPGGYVKQPDIGMYSNAMVMDLNSLYPNAIITLNISPETKVAKVVNRTDTIVTIELTKGRKMVDIPAHRFRELLEKKNWAISAADVIFDQTRRGLCAEFVDGLYKKRKAVKNQMLALESELTRMAPDTNEYAVKRKLSDQLDTEQYLYKILLNSTYGVLANRYFALYDLDCASSITLTSQELIRHSEGVCNDFMRDEWKLPEADRVIAIDTDSLILCVDDILQQSGSTMVGSNGELTDAFSDLDHKITDHLNAAVVVWAKETWNSADCRFEFKRESACPKALWIAKKHYIMMICNSEGVKMNNKMKYKGLSIVKSVYPDKTKDITREIIQGIFESPDKARADEVFFRSYDTFRNLDCSDIAVRSSINVIDKWAASTDGFKTGLNCPRNVKWVTYHNHLIDLLQLVSKYPLIRQGSKAKFVCVLENKYNIPGIAFLDAFPPEFDLKPDHDTMFSKCVVLCLEPIYHALGWSVPDPNKQYAYSVETLFS